MDLVDLRRTFKIQPAVHFLAVEGGDADPHALVGLVKSEEELAQEGYSKSLEFLAVARGDAQRQHAYVMGLVSPTLPEKSTEPRRFRSVLTVFVVSLLCFGIALLAVTAIREHGGAA